MTGEWQNSNTKRSWRGLQHEIAGFVCRHRKPTKSVSVLQLRIKPRTSLVIITAYRLAVQFVLEITRHGSDAISELYRHILLESTERWKLNCWSNVTPKYPFRSKPYYESLVFIPININATCSEA